MRPSRHVLTVVVLVAASLFTACKSEPPTTVEGWAKAIPEIKREKELRDASASLRSVAGEALRSGKDLKPAVPLLIPLLKENAIVRQDAAYILGEIGDPSAIDPLVESIDFSAAVADKDASRSNSKIAEALGKLQAKQAVRPLVKLAKSPDNFVALAAVKALGDTHDAAAVAPLMELATSETIDPYISRNAIESLGRLGDPAALPALIHMLFRERSGVSFYREASFAIFQVGADATQDLIDILDGKNKELMDWAKDKGVLEAAIYSKTAQVLGDLADPRSAPVLLKRLRYESDFVDMKLLPRMLSAEALGRIRYEKAVRPLASLLGEEEANARGTYARALVMIGDRAAVPALVRSATDGMGYDAREEALWAVAQLGGPGDLSKFDRAVKVNETMKTCTNWFECDPGSNRAKCMEEMEKECGKRIAKFQKRAAKYRPMLVAADECKDSVDCWIGKLKDENGRLREKAAWELGRSGEMKALDPLLAAAQEEDLKARFAILNAVDTLLYGANDQVPEPAVGRKVVDRMQSILKDESGKAHYIKINEDVKRLALKVQRSLRNAKAN